MRMRAGDVIRVPVGRRFSRSGEVLEVRGTPGHQELIVRWDDGHTSFYVPDERVSVVHEPASSPFEHGARSEEPEEE